MEKNEWTDSFLVFPSGTTVNFSFFQALSDRQQAVEFKIYIEKVMLKGGRSFLI